LVCRQAVTVPSRLHVDINSQTPSAIHAAQARFDADHDKREAA
jgi:hypothetical protein